VARVLAKRKLQTLPSAQNILQKNNNRFLRNNLGAKTRIQMTLKYGNWKVVTGSPAEQAKRCLCSPYIQAT